MSLTGPNLSDLCKQHKGWRLCNLDTGMGCQEWMVWKTSEIFVLRCMMVLVYVIMLLWNRVVAFFKYRKLRDCLLYRKMHRGFGNENIEIIYIY